MNEREVWREGNTKKRSETREEVGDRAGESSLIQKLRNC